MARAGFRAAGLLLAVLLIPACASRTSSEEAGIDQEITRNLLWRYRQDVRFADIHVSCEDREILLEGRVSDAKSAADAIQIALSHSRGGKVVSKLAVRPK